MITPSREEREPGGRFTPSAFVICVSFLNNTLYGVPLLLGDLKKSRGEHRMKSLEQFTHDVMKYVGSGYKYVKIAKVPESKGHKLPQIIKKVSEYYQTDISRGKRQYRRRQNKANYGMAVYGHIIVIFRTEGDHTDKSTEFQEIGKRLSIKISDYTTLVVFKDERDIWTIRLDRDTYRRIRDEILLHIKNGNRRGYRRVLQAFRRFPNWKGIGTQQKALYEVIRRAKKVYNADWVYI